ncbi:MAG: peptide chain release factor N(5)-glutamine methyltransferase [Deltaproteobacteria bacterium]|nr:peptide chain release factor N(5)-glutamine methyltransferase [Deltaproteobacteria bacterium]
MQTSTPDRVVWTILRLLGWTTEYFTSHGVASPRTDAEILLAHTLGLRRIDLYVRHEQPLSKPELGRFRKMVQRRAVREPVAYITGRKEFWSLNLTVSPAVLIPRPETECLVEAALDRLAALGDRSAPRRILDLGTGSGAVALALAAQRPIDLIFASDSSKAALVAAEKNALENGLAGRVQFFCAHWMNALHSPMCNFDLILSNPPYIPSGQIEQLQPEITRYEPRSALDGGPDGLGCIGHIIDNAPRFLRPGGWVLSEIGHDQGRDLKRIVEADRRYDAPAVTQDYGGHDRVLAIKLKK